MLSINVFFIFSSILSSLVKSSSILGYGQFIGSVVPIAMDKVVKKIVSGSLQLNVYVATQTTKELVLKVFSIS